MSDEWDNHSTNLKRVRETIANAVYEFWRERHQRDDCEFYIKELAEYVAIRHVVAPNSAYRVMYEMRKLGRINYEMVSRRQSRYRALPRMEIKCGSV
jgi:hypothetical protein